MKSLVVKVAHFTTRSNPPLSGAPCFCSSPESDIPAPLSREYHAQSHSTALLYSWCTQCASTTAYTAYLESAMQKQHMYVHWLLRTLVSLLLLYTKLASSAAWKAIYDTATTMIKASIALCHTIYRHSNVAA